MTDDGLRITNNELRGSELRASPNSAEDSMQRMRLFPKIPRVGFQIWLSRRNHSQEEFGFTCFLPTDPNAMLEVGARHAVIGLTIVRTHAGARADELVDKTIVHGPQGIRFANTIIASPNRAVRSSRS